MKRKNIYKAAYTGIKISLFLATSINYSAVDIIACMVEKSQQTLASECGLKLEKIRRGIDP